MRHERKFLIEENFQSKINYFLLENSFLNHYPSRIVNSIYYDTFCFRRYYESEEGISEREKCRIRFYNSDIKKLILEYKVKSSEIGWKNYAKLPPKKSEKKEHYKSILTKNSDNNICKLFIPRKLNKIDFPALFVSYKRYYYIAFDKSIRITVDTKINFGKMRNGDLIQDNINNIKCDFGVLEIKYDLNEENLDFIRKLSNLYSLTLSRFSKYCIGINSCY